MGFPIGALAGGSSASYNYNNSVNNSFTDSQSQSYTDGSGANIQAKANAEQANTSAFESWQRAAEYNAEQARIQREWQERMANTQYQRAIQDMEKAGLNPILAVANGISGAATGTGSSASMSVPNTFMSDTFANSASSSSSHGESSGEGHGESWSNSVSGLAEGLKQIGTALYDSVNAIISAKGVESGIEKIEDAYNDILPGAKDTYRDIMSSLGLWKVKKGNGWQKFVNQLK